MVGISQPFCERHLDAVLELGPVPVRLENGTSVPFLKSRLLASKARQLLNRQRPFFQKKQVALLCNNMTYRPHDDSCFALINIVRPTAFFENGTEVPFSASRRNIPEFYRERHRGAVPKKWLGYITIQRNPMMLNIFCAPLLYIRCCAPLLRMSNETIYYARYGYATVMLHLYQQV